MVGNCPLGLACNGRSMVIKEKSDIGITVMCKNAFIYLVLMFALAVSSCSVLFPRISPEELETLRHACSELATPSSFTKIRESKNERRERAIYSAQYYSKDGIDEVRQFFEESLIPKGWEYSFRVESSTNYLDFRKGKYSITVEFERFSFTRNKTYLVDCAWGIR